MHTHALVSRVKMVENFFQDSESCIPRVCTRGWCKKWWNTQKGGEQKYWQKIYICDVEKRIKYLFREVKLNFLDIALCTHHFNNLSFLGALKNIFCFFHSRYIIKISRFPFSLSFQSLIHFPVPHWFHVHMLCFWPNSTQIYSYRRNLC